MSSLDYEHIDPKFRHILGLPNAERIRFLDEPRWIGYDTAKNIMDVLQGLMLKPQKPRMPNLLLVGEPNNGKTTIARRFYSLCGEPYVRDLDDQGVKPIILAEAPPSADEKGLYVAILREFFTPHRTTDPVIKLRYQVVHLVREFNTKLIMIDEFHSLLSGSARKQREVMNALKFLCNELAIPVVGVGTLDAVRVLHTDPQHASRFEVISLPLWKPDEEFQQLLERFESFLPLKKASKLYERKLAMLLHSISEGNLGDLHGLLIECTIAAITSGKEYIDEEIIKSKSWIKPTSGIRERQL
jgi:hypothetical protein